MVRQVQRQQADLVAIEAKLKREEQQAAFLKEEARCQEEAHQQLRRSHADELHELEARFQVIHNASSIHGNN